MKVGLLTAAAAAMSGVLVAGWNLVGAAAVVAVLAVALGLRLSSKQLAVIGLVLVLLSRSVAVAIPWGPAGYLDESVTAFLFFVIVGRRLLAARPLRFPPGIALFSLFAVFGLLSSLVNDVPVQITSAGAVLAVKGVLLYFTLAQIDWTVADVRPLARAGAWFLGVVLVTGLVNLAIPQQWSSVLSTVGHVGYRSVLPSLIGPFTHPLQFGNFLALASIALWVLVTQGARVAGGRTLLLASLLGAVLSFRRTAIVGVIAAVSYLTLKRKNAGVLVLGLFAVPLVVILLAPLIQEVASSTYVDYIVGAEQNARTRMTLDSFRLAIQHFPFGVGFGRFGSSVAADHYSPVYVKLDYDNVYGLASPNNPHNHGRFLTDTQWPAIVGESGILGAFCFAAGLWLIFSTFKKASRDATAAVKLLGLTGMGWSLHILLQSIAYPVYVLTPTAPLLFGLAAITYVVHSGSAPPPKVSVTSPAPGDHSEERGRGARRRLELGRSSAPQPVSAGSADARTMRISSYGRHRTMER